MSNFEDETAQDAVEASVEITPDVEAEVEVAEEEVMTDEVAEVATEEQSQPSEPQAYQPVPSDGKPV